MLKLLIALGTAAIRYRTRLKLWALAFCLAAAVPAAVPGAQSVRSKEAGKTNADKQQEITLVRAKIDQLYEELSLNRSVQERTDISEGQKMQLQR
jgi:hypothetical protein